jgi:hypothetical protein
MSNATADSAGLFSLIENPLFVRYRDIVCGGGRFVNAQSSEHGVALWATRDFLARRCAIARRSAPVSGDDWRANSHDGLPRVQARPFRDHHAPRIFAGSVRSPGAVGGGSSPTSRSCCNQGNTLSVKMVIDLRRADSPSSSAND